MPEKPRVMEWLDLASKIAIPIAIFVATQQYNDGQNKAHDKESCIDLQIKIFGLACNNSECTVSTQRASGLLGLNDLIEERCKVADIQPARQVKDLLLTASTGPSSVEVVSALRAAGGVAAPTKLPDIPQAPSPVQAAVTSETASDLAPRVYVQTATRDQDAGAKALIAKLNTATLGGRTIRALGPELVSPDRSHVTQVEVRCVTSTDCAKAPELASYLGGILGAPVAVRDLSARLAASNKARPGHYELWFPIGPIQVSAAAIS